MLIDYLSLFECLETDFGTNSHHQEFEVGLSIDFLRRVISNLFHLLITQFNPFTISTKLFIMWECNGWSFLDDSLIDFLFSSFNFIHNGGINVELCSVSLSIKGVECLHQESDNKVHLLIILDDQVNSSSLQLKC